MRRWRRGAALAAAVMMVLSGCGAPAGTDGDLVDDWSLVGEVRQFTPAVGDCHLIGDPTGYLSSYQPVDCGRAHLVETFHVGRFTGASAARPTPPKVGSAALRPAYAECDTRAREFLGGDWHGARLVVQVVPPSPNGWAGGSRWFRCDLFEVSAVETGADNESDWPAQHAGTLRDALKDPASPLAYGCASPHTGGTVQVSCAAPHWIEYAGTWTAPETPFAALAGNENRINAACRTVIAGYVELPVDRLLPYRTGSLYGLPSQAAWARGDRQVRCFLWSYTQLKRSVRGAGPAALPVR
ncbi:septum formation family protein [Micromonospora auratinigra]|uniref:Septum formation n=1 Tax=Micromonospora auratinigra TaxID=261654 RepID=A0A1A8ZI54_9ACTN|nr:septum formation family protein [Micromonospora auratinigra]SBT43513.1 Septum formation [Micromonospora auratinigra]